MSTAQIAKERLNLVLADDHGRGTRRITTRDITVSALEMFCREPLPSWATYTELRPIPSDKIGQTIRFRSVPPRLPVDEEGV